MPETIRTKDAVKLILGVFSCLALFIAEMIFALKFIVSRMANISLSERWMLIAITIEIVGVMYVISSCIYDNCSKENKFAMFFVFPFMKDKKYISILTLGLL